MISRWLHSCPSLRIEYIFVSALIAPGFLYGLGTFLESPTLLGAAGTFAVVLGFGIVALIFISARQHTRNSKDFLRRDKVIMRCLANLEESCELELCWKENGTTLSARFTAGGIMIFEGSQTCKTTAEGLRARLHTHHGILELRKATTTTSNHA